MIAAGLVKELDNARRFFQRSTSALDESDSGFCPNSEMYTVAQQIAHVAHTVDWFVDGGFSSRGFDTDFANAQQEIMRVTSLSIARERFAKAFARAIQEISSKSDSELMVPFAPDDPIMPRAPKLAIVSGIVDHTAHHRGSLAVYARLVGKQPPMPYM